MCRQEDVRRSTGENALPDVASPESELTPSCSTDSTVEMDSAETIIQATKNDSGLPDAIDSLDAEVPNQPISVDWLPVQQLSKRTLTFQTSWFQSFPWLHCPTAQETAVGVLCFFCAKAAKLNLSGLATKQDDAFVSRGFCMWKRATEKFRAHEKSAAHLHAVSQLAQHKAPTVAGQISSQKNKDQSNCRVALLKLLTTVRYLARQGLALRGHESTTGNYEELLRLRADDCKELHSYLQRISKFTAPEAQNEMLAMISHGVLRRIVATVKEESRQYAIIVDGTQDCTGQEQESLCVRYVNAELEPAEAFLGLYLPNDTKGSTIADVIMDALLRFDLPIHDLRGQTYDGAANMAGNYNGCQAIIAQKQPLALHFHCGSHCSNLVMQAASVSCSLVREALECTHEVAVLVGRSGKCRSILTTVALELGDHFSPVKPLCPTRWLCRRPALQRILDQYEAVLQGLEVISDNKQSEQATKARGLLTRLQQGTLILGIKVALPVFIVLEELNQALQARNANLSGMLEAVSNVKDFVTQLRSDEKFREILESTNDTIADLDLEPLRIPRPRRPPARFSGPSECYVSLTVEEYYRHEFFKFVDTVQAQLTERFDHNSRGLSTYLHLETVLLSGQTSTAMETLAAYPEIDTVRLSTQLAMFKMQFTYQSLSEAKVTLQSMTREVRLMFTEVERLVRLMLLFPVSSCEAERSFSSLRRLKTWLRNTMTQQRLNAVIVCHVHQDILDTIDISAVAADFASRTDIRRSVFGNGPF